MHDDLVHRRRNVRHQLTRLGRNRVDVLHDDRHRGIAAERQGAGQHLVHDDAERIQIRPVVDLDALRLLRRDVVHRADRLRDLLGLLAVGEARDAEVHHLCRAVAQQHDVVRLDVLMDDAAAVRVIQRARHLLGEVNCLLPRQMVLLAQVVLERDALAQLHDDVLRLGVILRDVVDRNDIIVRQLGYRLCLVVKTLAELVVRRELFFQNLDCHITMQHGVICFVHNGHTAGADDLAHFIAAAKNFADIIRHILSPTLYIKQP